MSKYFAYHYPDSNGDDVQAVMSLKEILKEIVQTSEILGRGCWDREELIYSWIVVNWAYECDRDGNVV